MAKKTPKSVVSELTVSSAAAAALFGIKQTTLRTWKLKGAKGNTGRNSWFLPDLLLLWQYTMFESRQDARDDTLSEFKRQYWGSRAKLESLKADAEEGSLISVPEILEIYGSLMSRFKNGLLDFSTRLPPVVSGKSQSQMIGIIKTECCLLLAGFTGSEKYGKFLVPKEYKKLFAPTWDANQKKGKKK